MSDPIYEHDGLWYFWDETWAYFYGPFHSLEEAQRELERYVASLNDNPNSPGCGS